MAQRLQGVGLCDTCAPKVLVGQVGGGWGVFVIGLLLYYDLVF